MNFQSLIDEIHRVDSNRGTSNSDRALVRPQSLHTLRLLPLHPGSIDDYVRGIS